MQHQVKLRSARLPAYNRMKVCAPKLQYTPTVRTFRDLEEEWQAAKLGQSPKACQNPVISLAIRHSRTALKLICATPQAFYRLYTDS